MGVFPNQEYRAFSIVLNKEDILLLYSDGITDSIDRQTDEQKGLENLTELLMMNYKKTAKDISSEIFNFLENYKRMDDQTLMVVKKIE